MQDLGAAKPAQRVDTVQRRYRQLASVYPILEPLLWLPRGIRAKAVGRLMLGPGDRVVEVGCGTGRNLPHLVRAVGPTGRVYGVDVTPEMLAVARRSAAKHRWSNVSLLEGDAESLCLPERVDGVLFSLSYTVIPRHRSALENVYKLLRPGGRVVILDGGIPEGAPGVLLGPVLAAVSDRTVLGNAEKRPWEDLATLGPNVQTERIWPGIYYICWGNRAPQPAEP